ncbi:MAG: hypothetical protein ABEK84_01490, partial [Salinibacter sp.]
RPLRLAGASLPLLQNFEVGGIYATDQSNLATPGGSPVTIWGADAGLPIALGPIVQVVPYAAYATIADPGAGAFVTADPFEPGSGASVGVNVNVQVIADLFSVSAKVERRFFGKNFTGSYFDAVYETNQLGFQQGVATHPFRKIEGSGENGTFGALYGHVVNKILIGGSLQIPDEITRDAKGRVQNGAFLHLEARAPNLIPKVTARAEYNRSPITDLSDAIVLDENSTLDMRVGYKVKPYLLVGTNYRWTFARVQENGNEVVKATSHVFPFVALQYSFGGGS